MRFVLQQNFIIQMHPARAYCQITATQCRISRNSSKEQLFDIVYLWMLISNIQLDRHFLCGSIAIPGAGDVPVAVAAPVAKMTIDVAVIDAMGVAVIVAADAVLFASALPAPVRQKHFHCPGQGSEPEVAAVTSQIPETNVDRASAVAAVDMGLASAAGMNYIQPPSGAWASGFPL